MSKTNKSSKRSAENRPERLAGQLTGLTYERNIKPRLDLIEAWARSGLSNNEIGHNLGYSVTGFARYIYGTRAVEELVETIDRGRFDSKYIIENSFYKRCTGYSYWEVERERRRELDEDGDWTGKWIMVTVRRVLKHIPGDANAALRWLERRDPDRWGPDRKQGEHDETDQDGFLAALSVAAKSAWMDEVEEPEEGDEDEDEDND